MHLILKTTAVHHVLLILFIFCGYIFSASVSFSSNLKQRILFTNFRFWSHTTISFFYYYCVYLHFTRVFFSSLIRFIASFHFSWFLNGPKHTFLLKMLSLSAKFGAVVALASATILVVFVVGNFLLNDCGSF